jgi:8-oxo-dGTP pyrophosphatase MutT (NUDIX family)
LTQVATALHADAVAVLTAYVPADERQATLRDDYLWLLAERPDATWRECLPAHLTASAVVLDAAGERALLVLHGKAHKWLQMGGHCEPADPSMAAAALREAREESGVGGLRLLGDGPVLLDRHPAPCAAEWHYDVMYAALAPAGADGVVTEETLGIGWFPPDALPEPTDDAVRALVAAALARFRTSAV